MAEGTAPESENPNAIDIKIRCSSIIYSLSLSTSTTIGDLKNTLSTSEYANVPPNCQRLIYSGRVLEDSKTLAALNIQKGHTIFLVKSERNTVPKNSANQSASGSTRSDGATASAVPTHIASGTGNDTLPNLTGARYAGFIEGLPDRGLFGPDGGMTGPPGGIDLERILDDPSMISQMFGSAGLQEALQQSPMMRENPELLRLIQDPEFQQMMQDPNVIRTIIQMQRYLGRVNSGSNASSFPVPGVMETTPMAQTGQQQQPSTRTAGDAANAAPVLNPFAAMFPGATNPLAAGTDRGATTNQSIFPQNQADMQNFMRMIDRAGASGGGGGGGAESNPFARTLFGGAAAGMPFPPQRPADNLPPEERYADQLMQLNDMGFFEFDRNVQALRRSGGNVQGAVEFLLGGS